MKYIPILIHPFYALYQKELGWDTFSRKKHEYGNYNQYKKNIESLIGYLNSNKMDYVNVMENGSERKIDGGHLTSENTIKLITPDYGENHRIIGGFFDNKLILGEEETLEYLMRHIEKTNKIPAFAGEYVWYKGVSDKVLEGCLTLFIKDYFMEKSSVIIKDHIFPLKKPENTDSKLLHQMYNNQADLTSLK